MSKGRLHPETVAEANGLPIESLRVLRELFDAAESNDPLSFLVRAHGELQQYIENVREKYINSASALLTTAGAGAELEVMQPFPAPPGMQPQPQQSAPKAKVTGFQPNKEDK